MDQLQTIGAGDVAQAFGVAVTLALAMVGAITVHSQMTLWRFRRSKGGR